MNTIKKLTCRGDALAFSEAEESQAQIKDIVVSDCDYGTEMIASPCPVRQMNVEIYQGAINRTYRTNFKMPATFYSQLMTFACGGLAMAAGLDGRINRAEKLEEITGK